MKYKHDKNKEEINPFEDGKEDVLTDLWNKWGVVIQTLKKKEMAVHHTNMKQQYEELFGVLVSIEEMIELSDFFENDYADYMRDKIHEDRKNGMLNIDPKFYM